MDENEVAALLNTTSDTDCVMQNGREDIPLMTQTPYEIQPKAQSDDTVSIHIDRRALNQVQLAWINKLSSINVFSLGRIWQDFRLPAGIRLNYQGSFEKKNSKMWSGVCVSLVAQFCSHR